jgi:hypothetical protein
VGHWGVGVRWSKVASCNAVSGIWPIFPEIYCMTPILATHLQGHIYPFVGPNPEMGVPNMRLGVGEPPRGMGWGAGARWSEVASCNAVSSENK